MENNNLTIYNALRSVPPEAQKSFNNGRFSGTDINPMWRIKKMTETFGVCGFGWYVDIVKREIVTSADGTQAAFVAINLYVKIGDEWSKPIYGEGGNNFCAKNKSGNSTTSDEAYKMAYTDALSNATKYIGLGADIWFQRDVTKYTAQSSQPTKMPVQHAQQAQVNIEDAIDEISACKTSEEVKALYSGKYRELQNNAMFKNHVLKVGQFLANKNQQQKA